MEGFPLNQPLKQNVKSDVYSYISLGLEKNSHSELFHIGTM